MGDSLPLISGEEDSVCEALERSDGTTWTAEHHGSKDQKGTSGRTHPFSRSQFQL